MKPLVSYLTAFILNPKPIKNPYGTLPEPSQGTLKRKPLKGTFRGSPKNPELLLQARESAEAVGQPLLKSVALRIRDGSP